MLTWSNEYLEAVVQCDLCDCRTKTWNDVKETSGWLNAILVAELATKYCNQDLWTVNN